MPDPGFPHTPASANSARLRHEDIYPPETLSSPRREADIVIISPRPFLFTLFRKLDPQSGFRFFAHSSQASGQDSFFCRPHTVDKQNSIEMVNFVLYHPSKKTVHVEGVGLALEIIVTQANTYCSSNRRFNIGKAEAAFLHGIGFGGRLGQLWVK